MGSMLQDARYALRYLLRSPGFTVVAVLTLALGIGANSAIFSVVDGVLLEPLPFVEPDRLMVFSTRLPTLGHDDFPLSVSEFLDYQEDNQAFAKLGVWTQNSINLASDTEPLRVTAILASTEMLDVLGTPPLMGRGFQPGDDEPGKPEALVLSEELWRRAFGADPGILGRKVEYNGRTAEVVGVMPAGFDLFDVGAEVWLPFPINRSDRTDRANHVVTMVGRLAPGMSEAQAQADLALVMQRWSERPRVHHRFGPDIHMLQLKPLREEMVGKVRPALWMLLGAVGFVLLIACANVANLLLMRAESRRKEISVRAALGAGRLRLLRQFLTEGMVLALVGGSVGLLASYWGLRLLLAAYPNSVPRAGAVGLDTEVVLFTLGVTLLTGVISGLAPTLHLRDRSLTQALREGGQRTTAGSARHLLRRVLVVVEVALALVLVVGAGLMLRSLWSLLDVDAGFEAKGVLTFHLLLPRPTYPENRDVVGFYDRLLTRLEALPGVENAALARALPPQRPVDAFDADFEGLEPPPPGEPRNVDYWQFVTEGFFPALGIRIVEGRGLTATDTVGAPPVVLVNQQLARVFWPGESAVGKRVRPRGPYPWFTVVGVVDDVKLDGLGGAVGTEIYLSYPQTSTDYIFLQRGMYVVVRSALPPSRLVTALQREVHALDPALPLDRVRTMQEVIGQSVALQSFMSWLLGIFGGLALVLAAVGTYGVLAYGVSERRREIGVRMALGAEAGQVVGMLLGQGLRVTAVGLALGIALALALGQLLTYRFYGLESNDPVTLVGVVLFIALVAAVAAWLPARRAARVDPVEVLREE